METAQIESLTGLEFERPQKLLLPRRGGDVDPVPSLRQPGPAEDPVPIASDNRRLLRFGTLPAQLHRLGFGARNWFVVRTDQLAADFGTGGKDELQPGRLLSVAEIERRIVRRKSFLSDAQTITVDRPERRERELAIWAGGGFYHAMDKAPLLHGHRKKPRRELPLKIDLQSGPGHRFSLTIDNHAGDGRAGIQHQDDLPGLAGAQFQLRLARRATSFRLHFEPVAPGGN